MPLYEYQCEECGQRFERIRKFSDPPLDEPCPKCGGPIRKLISSPAIQFKGKGWYVTDYAKSGSTEPSKADAATSEASADAKSDAKKEKKTDAGAATTTEAKTETKTEAPKPAAPAPAKVDKT
ncbi:MAG TPA: FmdB family zinc ribbon protein [Vicinamibacterales bacterium]|nr:FmdB family zinc ribbon protein [Vicinamibacterales bacterium]